MQSLHETQPFVAVSDVTEQRLYINALDSPSNAISRKVNAQPNRHQRRIYTSTPKNGFNKQQRNGAVGFCNLLKATAKHYNCVGVAAAAFKRPGQKFDVRLKALLVLFGIVIIIRVITLTMPYINGNSAQQMYTYVQEQLDVALNWSEEQQLRSKLSPLLCGFLLALFSYGIVYMDSAVPGVYPPAPFTRSSNQRNEKRLALTLNYMCALSVGVLVTIFMYLNLL